MFRIPSIPLVVVLSDAIGLHFTEPAAALDLIGDDFTIGGRNKATRRACNGVHDGEKVNRRI